MRSIPSIDALEFENLLPNTQVGGIVEVAQFDDVAEYTGALLLDQLHKEYPQYPFLFPEDTIHNSLRIAHRLGIISNNTTVQKMAAIFVEPTIPPHNFHVRGAHRNFISTLRIGQDAFVSLETVVFVEVGPIHKRGSDYLTARKTTRGDIKVHTLEEYTHWLKESLHRPHRKKVKNPGVELKSLDQTG